MRLSKKFVYGAAATLTAFCFTACGNGNNNNQSQNSGQESQSQRSVEESTGMYNPGTYKGTAQGYGGEVEVSIEVDDNNITGVQATGENETAGIGSNAIEQLPDEIKEANSADVDGVAGATVTSDAVKAAAKEALDQAKEGK